MAGWSKAFDELGLLEEYKKKVAVVRYADKEGFNLEHFTPGFFPAGNSLLDEPPSTKTSSYEEYGLEANGLPCYCRTINFEGLPVSAGFYRYTQEAVVFIRYDLSYSVPLVYQKIVLLNGRKTAIQKAVANGGGFRFSGKTSEEALELAKREEHSIFLFVKRYEYENERIVKDVSHNRAPGLGEYGFKGYYKYDTDGTLLEIRDMSVYGLEQLRYCHWDESEGLQGLTGRLAAEMAESITKALIEEKIKEPLAILQLGYHYADSYLPILNPLFVKEKEEAIAKKNSIVWQELFLHINSVYHAELKGIEKTFAQFMNQVDSQETYDMAREMLQKTSALLTASRLNGSIPTDPEFFAYAIDHSIDGHDAEDFKDILLKCGMPEKQYEKWSERGWTR